MLVLLCDLCADPSQPVRWRYPARDFAVPSPEPSIGLASRGDWAACAPCHALIDAESWADLARRSARSYAVKYEVPVDDILPAIVILHALFADVRQGAPVPVTA